MNNYNVLANFFLLYYYFNVILSIDINNVQKESLFSKFINKITLRPLNIFSSVDFILDKQCVIYPEKYIKSDNIILNCILKENEILAITFKKRHKKINVYQNDVIIKKIYIKVGENVKVDLCIEKYLDNNSTKSCRTIAFWVINEYEPFHKKFIGYDDKIFNDDHFVKFIEKSNESNGTLPYQDKDNESISCVILEKNLNGKINKFLLSPTDGIINVNIEFGSKLILHLPQYQDDCGNILDKISNNSKNPSLIYFIDNKRLGFGPLSIDILSPELSNIEGDKETTRSFFLSTLNKNSNKRAFVLFLFNYSENKLLDDNCLEMTIDEKFAKSVVSDQNDFKLPINVFKCFNNDKKTDIDPQNVLIDISKSDGIMIYMVKLIDPNNTFLYINDKLQESGFYQHNIFLNPSEKESVEYVVKDRDDLVLSKINLTFLRKQSHSYVYYMNIIFKCLTFPAILIDFKGVIDLWLINKLLTSDKDALYKILYTPSEFSLISEQNNIIKNYGILDKLTSLILIGNLNIYTDKNESFEESYINYIYYSICGLLSSIIINIITLLLLLILKSNKLSKSYTKVKMIFISIIPYTLIFTLYSSLNVLFMNKFNIIIKELLISNNALIFISISCILLSLLIYKMNSNLNRNITKDIITYCPWKDSNYVLKFPEMPYFPVIKWPLPVLGETNLIKICLEKNYFLIEYKLNISIDGKIDKDFYQLSIISATFNEMNGSESNIQKIEENISILYTPSAWIKTDISGKGIKNTRLITNINLSDIFILSLRGCNENFYVHHSQTIPNKLECSIYYIFVTVFLLSYSNIFNNIYLKNFKIYFYILLNVILKINDYRGTKIHKFQNEWFKSNVYKSKLVDLSSYGILIGVLIIEIAMYINKYLNIILMKGIIILSLLIMFSSIVPSIIIVCIWTKDIILYYSKMYNNIIKLLFSYLKINNFITKHVKIYKNENYYETTNPYECSYHIENTKSKSSLIYNSILNSAKPISELNILKFTFIYNNIPISPSSCYTPILQYKKLLYYFGELKEQPNGIDINNKSNLTICANDEFNINTDMTNLFASVEISRPIQISKSIPNINNNCLSLYIKPPNLPKDEWNKLYDLNYDDENHKIIITGPFIIPSGTYMVRASIKNGCQSESDSNFLTSMIADNCKCEYYGILNVPINPDYIKHLNIYKKIHICMYSSGKSISFTINPKSIYVEINSVSNHMILRSQNFVQGNVYKVQYKCLPNMTNTGFIESVIADNNVSKIQIPIAIPKENFNYKLYEYHVTNFIDITCSITHTNDNWGFHDDLVSKIITSYPKIWGLSNILDYKIPCTINRNLENFLYRITPKYNIAATIAQAQKECLMSLYSTLILNRINSLEFVGFYFYDRSEINDFFNKFGILLQLDDLWINPMSDSAIEMYGYETMQKAYNALYLDLKSKLEFYINLSEQLVTHLWEMKSLYDMDIVLEAIDCFDNLTLNNTCIDSALELTIKRVSRDIPQNLIKKLLFPPVISGENIKWNIHLSNQLDKWKGEVKTFFDIKIGVLNSFSMLTSSYAIPLDYTISCLGNSLRRLSNEFNLPYIIDGSHIEHKLTHIVITEKSLISVKNDWNIPSIYLHSTSFSSFMGYVKISYPYDSLDIWHPTFLNWRPHGVIFDVINMDQIYVKFTDMLSMEIDCDFDNSRNEPSILNGLFASEKMSILSLTSKNNSFKTMNIDSNINDYRLQGVVHKTYENYKIYFKTTCSNNKYLELILNEYTTISKVENDKIIIMEAEENSDYIDKLNIDQLESTKGSIQEPLIGTIDNVENI